MSSTPHVVIVGGGFAGIAAAQSLKNADVRITLIDRRNHHLFQPLLYQVATAALAPADIAEPIRAILSKQKNAKVVLGEASSVDADAKRIRVGDRWFEYDWLVLAAGGRHAYFGNPQWEKHAPGLKTIGDALEIRRRILTAYERAEWEEDDAVRQRLMTFVVVGGGPTGVEVAGAIADISRLTLRRDFRNIDTERTRIVLVEGLDSVLGAYDAPLPDKACQQLASLGVDVMLETQVTDIDEDGVTLKSGERIEAATVVWAAGVQGSSVGHDAGWQTDRTGRVPVNPDLSVPGYDHVFVIGDQALVNGPNGPVPGVAPAALQMGKHVGKAIRASLAGNDRPAFRYIDRGSMATIGRARAIAQTGRFKLSGFVAWLAWVFIHILFLITFRNRLVVLLKWAWAWVMFDRSSRLVWETEPNAHPSAQEDEVQQ